jgi:HSP20 family protein
MTTGLIRWNPGRQLLRNRMDRLFNEMLQNAWGELPDSEEAATRDWSPLVDIRENDATLQFHVELPGMTKDNVEITVENNVLTVSGERKFEKETKEQTFHRVERAYGGFSRSFTLPTTVQTDKVAARFDNGVLEITLPKAEESKPRKIDIG